MSSYKWCAVPQCTNTSIKTPAKLFVSVPVDMNIRKKWMHLARRNADDMSPKTRPYFCEDHFNIETDMKNHYLYKIGFHKKIIMKDGVLPSKFHCQPDHRKRTCEAETSRPAFAIRHRHALIEQCESDHLQPSQPVDVPLIENVENISAEPPEPDGQLGLQIGTVFSLNPSCNTTLKKNALHPDCTEGTSKIVIIVRCQQCMEPLLYRETGPNCKKCVNKSMKKEMERAKAEVITIDCTDDQIEDNWVTDIPEPFEDLDESNPEFIKDLTDNQYTCLKCHKRFPIRLMAKIHNCPKKQDKPTCLHCKQQHCNCPNAASDTDRDNVSEDNLVYDSPNARPSLLPHKDELKNITHCSEENFQPDQEISNATSQVVIDDYSTVQYVTYVSDSLQRDFVPNVDISSDERQMIVSDLSTGHSLSIDEIPLSASVDRTQFIALGNDQYVKHSDYNVHLDSVENKDCESDPELLMCFQCYQTFHDENTLWQHTNKEHPLSQVLHQPPVTSPHAVITDQTEPNLKDFASPPKLSHLEPLNKRNYWQISPENENYVGINEYTKDIIEPSFKHPYYKSHKRPRQNKACLKKPHGFEDKFEYEIAEYKSAKHGKRPDMENMILGVETSNMPQIKCLSLLSTANPGIPSATNKSTKQTAEQLKVSKVEGTFICHAVNETDSGSVDETIDLQLKGEGIINSKLTDNTVAAAQIQEIDKLVPKPSIRNEESVQVQTKPCDLKCISCGRQFKFKSQYIRHHRKCGKPEIDQWYTEPRLLRKAAVVDTPKSQTTMNTKLNSAICVDKNYIYFDGVKWTSATEDMEKSCEKVYTSAKKIQTEPSGSVINKCEGSSNIKYFNTTERSVNSKRMRSKLSNALRKRRQDKLNTSKCKPKQKDLGDMSDEEFHKFLLNQDDELSEHSDPNDCQNKPGPQMYDSGSCMNTFKNNIIKSSSSRETAPTHNSNTDNDCESPLPSPIHYKDYHKVMETKDKDLFSKSQLMVKKGKQIVKSREKVINISDYYRVWDKELYCCTVEREFNVKLDHEAPITDGVLYLHDYPVTDATSDSKSNKTINNVSDDDSSSKQYTISELEHASKDSDSTKSANENSFTIPQLGTNKILNLKGPELHKMQESELQDVANKDNRPKIRIRKSEMSASIPSELSEIYNFEFDWDTTINEEPIKSNNDSGPRFSNTILPANPSATQPETCNMDQKQEEPCMGSEIVRDQLIDRENAAITLISISELGTNPSNENPVPDKQMCEIRSEFNITDKKTTESTKADEPKFDRDQLIDRENAAITLISISELGTNPSNENPVPDKQMCEIRSEFYITDKKTTEFTKADEPKFPQPITVEKSILTMKKECLVLNNTDENSNCGSEIKDVSATVQSIKDKLYDLTDNVEPLLESEMCMEPSPPALMEASPSSRQEVKRLQLRQMKQLTMDTTVPLIRCDSPSWSAQSSAGASVRTSSAGSGRASSVASGHANRVTSARSSSGTSALPRLWPDRTRRVLAAFINYITRSNAHTERSVPREPKITPMVVKEEPKATSWLCDVCGQVFSCRLQLNTHTRRHRHECVCRQTFGTKQELIQHSMQHRSHLLAILGIAEIPPAVQQMALPTTRRSTDGTSQMVPLPRSDHVSLELVWQPKEYINRYLDMGPT